MIRVQERRRHNRTAIVRPAVLRDKSGAVFLRGRSADIAPGGIRLVGPGGSQVHEGQRVWVELAVESPRGTRIGRRIVKVGGAVRRLTTMGEWRSVVVVFETDFSERSLAPVF